MRKSFKNNCLVALLIAGSAISLLSCREQHVTSAPVSLETLMSESSDSLTVVVTENGRSSYRFYSPLVEGYSLAREPYREFRKGVKIITYLNDSLTSVDAILTSNYAINYSKLQLWEAKGDVVIIKHDGKELYTQQLFWNSATKRIYSNVDTKIVDTSNGDVYNGEGFESDEDMKDWSFRKMKGRMQVDVSPTENSDSTKVEGTPAPSKSPAAPTAPQTAAPERPRGPRGPATQYAAPKQVTEQEGSPSRSREIPHDSMMRSNHQREMVKKPLERAAMTHQ